MNPATKPEGGKIKRLSVTDEDSFDALIDHIEAAVSGSDSTISIGLRGIYKDELGKIKLRPSTLSTERRDGTIRKEKLPGTSVTLAVGDWDYDPRSVIIDGFKKALSLQKRYRYGDSGTIAIVAGTLKKNAVFNDIGEAVLGNAKVIGYLEGFDLPNPSRSPGEQGEH